MKQPARDPRLPPARRAGAVVALGNGRSEAAKGRPARWHVACGCVTVAYCSAGGQCRVASRGERSEAPTGVLSIGAPSMG